jgi:hypothetical protein
MNTSEFFDTFKDCKLKQIKAPQNCVIVDGDKIISLGVFVLSITIHG